MGTVFKSLDRLKTRKYVLNDLFRKIYIMPRKGIKVILYKEKISL